MLHSCLFLVSVGLRLYTFPVQAYALGRLQGAGGWLVPHEYDDWILASRIIGASVILSSTVQASYEMCQILAQGPSNYMT